MHFANPCIILACLYATGLSLLYKPAFGPRRPSRAPTTQHIQRMGLLDGFTRGFKSGGDPLKDLELEGEDRLKAYAQRVNSINKLESSVETLPDVELKERTADFRRKIARGEKVDGIILEEVFAIVREASYRVLGLRHFDVQLMGGMALSEGRVCEMATGEGKTLVALLVAYLFALKEEGSVCVCTVNDYLARRDADSMGQVLKFLGLSVGCIQNYMTPQQRREAYACDVTYAPNQELGFDFLRDQLVTRKEDVVLTRPVHMCVIDEFDSVCVDDARTPLVISQAQQAASSKISTAMKIVELLIKGVHYEVDTKNQKVTLTEAGYSECEGLLGGSLFNPANPWAPYLINALKAKELFAKDKEYIVRDGKVAIVDSSSGRVLEGRRYTDGLQQAIEVKEKLNPSSQTQVIAKITYPYLLKQFENVAGMTGTAWSEAVYILQTYNMRTIRIPTALSVARKDYPDVVYKTKDAKLRAVVKEVKRAHAIGRPVLVGTRSVEDSEKLCEMIEMEIGVLPAVLNAKPENAEREGAIIAQAGTPGSVLVSTNMGGRGTDILLGGNPKQFMIALTCALMETRLGVSPHLTFPASSDDLKSFAQAVNLTIPGNLSDEAAAQLLSAVNVAAETHWTKDSTDAVSVRVRVFDVVSTAAENSPSSDPLVLELRGAIYAGIHQIDETVREDRERVKKAGGLYVIGTERHESVRIDRQLRGRAGRQGDPGGSRFFVSLEDDIFKVFGGDKMKELLERFRVSEDLPIESDLVVASLNSVQQSVERYFFEMRMQVQQWDDIISTQRDDIYARRRGALSCSDDEVVSMFKEFCDATITDIVNAQSATGAVNADKISTLVSQFFPPIKTSTIEPAILKNQSPSQLIAYLTTKAREAVDSKLSSLDSVKSGFGAASVRYLILLQIDNLWGTHLSGIEALKEEVYLRRFKGADPLSEFTRDSVTAYSGMWGTIKRNSVYSLMIYAPPNPNSNPRLS